jgi:hypothetical protein
MTRKAAKRPTRKASPKHTEKKTWPLVAWLDVADARRFDALAKSQGQSRSAFARALLTAALAKRRTRKPR